MDWSFVGALILGALTIGGWIAIGWIVFTQSERAERRRRELEDAAMRQATPRAPLDITI